MGILILLIIKIFIIVAPYTDCFQQSAPPPSCYRKPPPPIRSEIKISVQNFDFTSDWGRIMVGGFYTQGNKLPQVINVATSIKHRRCLCKRATGGERVAVAFIVSVRQDTTLLTVGIADTHGLDDKKLECLEGTTLNKKII